MFSLKKKQPIVTSRPAASGPNLQNPKILEVNLIKDEAQVHFDWNRGVFIVIFLLILTSALVVEICLGLNWWENQENSRIEELKQEAAKLDQESAALEDDVAAAMIYKEKSAAFSSLLDNHIYWNNFFSWLEKNTLSTIRFLDFSGDLTGEYNLSGQAQSLADVSWQVKILAEDPMTKKVEVLSASVGERGDDGMVGPVKFNLHLEVDPALFLKQK